MQDASWKNDQLDRMICWAGFDRDSKKEKCDATSL